MMFKQVLIDDFDSKLLSSLVLSRQNLTNLFRRILVRPRASQSELSVNTSRGVPYNRLSIYPNRQVQNQTGKSGLQVLVCPTFLSHALCFPPFGDLNFVFLPLFGLCPCLQFLALPIVLVLLVTCLLGALPLLPKFDLLPDQKIENKTFLHYKNGVILNV